MRIGAWSMGLTLLLAACGGAAPKPAEDAAATSTQPEAEVSGPERHILAFGDSLFAGYEVGRENSYPAQLEAALRAQGINAVVTNAGISGETTGAGLQRLSFTLDAQDPKPDLVILELGGNDILRSLPPEKTRENLDAMLAELGKRDIPVLLMGMRAPPNLGGDFVASFDSIYPDLAKKHGVALVPFFMEAIYDKPQLILPDHIHPTTEGIGVLVKSTLDEVAASLPPAPANEN